MGSPVPIPLFNNPSCVPVLVVSPCCNSNSRLSHPPFNCPEPGTGTAVAPGGRAAETATVGPMRVATWNVNSVKQRLPRLLPWLDQRQPDVVCLQETKLADDAFAELLGDELARRGYAAAYHGEAQWNGVAILSRVGLDDVVVGIAAAPGFPH